MVDVDDSLLPSFANFAPKWRKYEQEGKLQRVQALHAHTSGRSAVVRDVRDGHGHGLLDSVIVAPTC